MRNFGYFRRPIRGIRALICILTLSACGGGSGDVFDSASLLGGGMQAGEVRALIFGDNNVAKTSFSELSGEEEFTLLLFAANPSPASYPVQIQSLSLSAEKSLQLPEPAEAVPAESDEDATSQLHQSLRDAETSYIGQEPFDPESDHDASKSLANSGCANGGLYFKVLTSLSNTSLFTQVCGVPVRTTANAIYYVDTAVFADLPNAALTPVIDAFEAKIPYERALFGSESDVDKNGKITVLFSPAVNRLGAESGGFVTGFFFGGDLFPGQGNAGSNQGEVLFSCVPDPEGRYGVSLPIEFWVSNIARAVLPHEFQHMISFNQKVLLQNIAPELPWLNEAISHFVEDLEPSAGGDPNHFSASQWMEVFAKPGPENPSRVQLYLGAPEANPFTAGISLSQRGGSYLAIKYLFEQANLGRYPGTADGRDLMNRLLSSPEQGIESVEASTGWLFKDLLLDFFATLQLSGTGANGDARYNFHGICLTCEQDDGRGTILTGVQNQELTSAKGSGNVASSGGIFFKISGATLTQAGQGLSFSAPTDMIAGGAVIRTR